MFKKLNLLALVGTATLDRKSTRLNSSHLVISYAVFCLKKKNDEPLCQYIMILSACQQISVSDLSQRMNWPPDRLRVYYRDGQSRFARLPHLAALVALEHARCRSVAGTAVSGHTDHSQF